ncbi:MAG TPA: M28 family peptidase [Anaeromyxobacter sp.]|nr:M28 family peptidase [Anaeromyxobacter sp.]
MLDVRPPRRLVAALALLGALAAAAVLRAAPVSPRGEDAPATEFSASRALVTVRALAGHGAPRTTGSPADLTAVELIAASLRGLGLETEVQQTFGCGPYGTCAPVRNVVARLGPAGRKAVLLVAHHDSVPASPGAADDASGVAIVVEVARALAAGPPLARPFVAVVTDAEEAGLVGAAAFARSHPRAADAGAVVNLEARGTTGPSIMFDTSGDPAWTARALRRLRHPVTTSVAPAVYDLLPNDTDLTVLERSGMPGLNLAFALGVPRYHTPLDDVAHLDLRSLQHQGESALALVRAAAEEPLETPARARLVYFDVLALGVVSYRAPLAVALLGAALVAAAAFLLLRRAPRRVRRLVAGLVAALAAPVAALGAVLLAWTLLRGGALSRTFVASPGPFSAAGWALGAAAALAAAALAARRAGAEGLFAGAAGLHAILGVALAAALPGASHVSAIPALAAGAAGLGWALARRGRDAWLAAAALAPALAAGAVVFSLAYLLPHLLGVVAAAGVAAAVALAVVPLAPLAAGARGRGRFVPAAALAAVGVVLVLVQAFLPPATAEAPERATISFHEEAGQARWLVEAETAALPGTLGGAATFAAERTRAFPWAPNRPAFTAAAAPLHLPAPRLEVLDVAYEGGLRRVRARLSSPRGAPRAYVVLPPASDVAAFEMEGVAVPAPAPKVRHWWGGWRVHGCAGLPPGGVELEVGVRGDAPLPVLVVDESPGLPPDGERLRAARPANAAPSQQGDATYVTARATL